MEFRLKTFAAKELAKYKVTRKEGHTLDNPQGTEKVMELQMVIYKGENKSKQVDEAGGRTTGKMKGKAFKKDGLQEDDVVEVEGMKWRVTQLFPRMYADFAEFEMEYMRNGK